MIGIDFIGFLILLIISVIVTAIFHFGLKYYVIPGWYSFLSKVIVGWIGAWLGSPVFGYWFEGLVYEQIYIIPAILGAAAANILVVDICKTLKS
uniref:GlsB/YeaQ/YmgE family stress response membrane protein n=1 Tax=Thermodesulfobacterium geofontis TaxID=1295609 RepID=A0A7V5XH69_9BACT